ncbi:uncharacterized protein LOC135074096 [Ostrinia nubilalis]|uniref:uncharacterized protein LOC135074096 n=1 Tax=Ostrinia nubilalis TaxID=29057 RepID=UPI0030825E65
MAWTFFPIFLALTTISAYNYPYPSYYRPYQAHNYEASPYRRHDALFVHESGEADYEDRSSEVRQDYQEPRAESSQYQERAEERSIRGPFRNKGQRLQEVLVASPEDIQPRNGNSSYKIVNSAPKTYPSITNRRGVDTESAVVFPGPTSETRKMFSPQVSKECEEVGICENSPDYPHEYVEALLAKSNVKFNLDVDTPEIAQRGGPPSASVDQGEELCDLDVRILYPDKVQTKTGKWLYAVNTKQKKVQGFRGTMCKSPSRPCKDIVFVAGDHVTTCEQKRMDRFIWVVNENGKLEEMPVPMPTCCTCVIRKNTKVTDPS